MTDETTPQDDAAMSPASTGSVAERFLLSEISVAQKYNVLVAEQEAEIRRLRLTDTEREAIRVARDAYADDDGNAECEIIAAVLSGLLERTK